MSLQANDLFHGRYRLIEERGRGSFGEVWLARDEELDIDVAVKIYIALDDRGIEEFKAEYKTVFEMRHSNILRADHYDVCDNRPYLVMSYCPESASSLIGSADEGTVWQFINDVARGLAYLHSKEVVHRDIKPDNILRDKDGTFVITDFGISKRMRSTLRRNSLRVGNDAEISGTIGYMAPELFSSHPDAVKATDIWALGATIFEMVTGELPFMGQGGVMLLHGAEVPTLESPYSPELSSVVSACLSCDTWQRPTAEELSNYAKAYIAGKKAPMPWLSRSGGGVEDVSRATQRRVNTNVGMSNTERDNSNNVSNYNEVGKEKVNSRVGRPLWALIFLLLLIVGGFIWFLCRSSSSGHGAVEQIVSSGTPVGAGTSPASSADNVDPFADYMVCVDGGTFTMGATSEQGSDAESDEKPAHRVILSSFEISKYEVTQKQWFDVMGYYPGSVEGDDFPVVNVSWNDVKKFIEKLNAKTGKNYRLPTEAEWEFAARGGNKSQHYKYSGSDNINEVAWYSGNSGGKTHPVGQKKANELGLYDMSGNVWEWCEDKYENVYPQAEQTNPKGPTSGFFRVHRGGSWYDVARDCRVSNRGSNLPGLGYYSLGFRLALSL